MTLFDHIITVLFLLFMLIGAHMFLVSCIRSGIKEALKDLGGGEVEYRNFKTREEMEEFIRERNGGA